MAQSLARRFDFATELRAFAAEVERLELASSRDPESPMIARCDLVQRMRNRAAEVMRREDPFERGIITADTLFRKAGPVVVDVRRVLRTGAQPVLKVAA